MLSVGGGSAPPSVNLSARDMREHSVASQVIPSESEVVNQLSTEGGASIRLEVFIILD